MNRFWLKSYPDDIAADIDFGNYCNVLDFFQDSVSNSPDNPAFSSFGTTLSFAETDKLSQTFASYLQHQLGMKKGDRLAIMLPNILQYPIALFGAIRIGVVVVNIDPLYTQRELTYQLNDSGADALLFLNNFGDVVQNTLPDTNVKHAISTSVGECLAFPKSVLINSVIRYVKKAIPKFRITGCERFSHALKKGSVSSCHDAQLNLDDIVFLQYTGGTTGVSKGAILSHRNIVANVLQAKQWVSNNFVHGQEKAITALPIYHIFSMTANIMTMMSMGIENILIANPRDFKGFVKFLKKTPFTIFIGVNTLFRKLLDTPGFEDIPFQNIKLSFLGGMSVTQDVAMDWQKATGSVVVEAYGLTETSPAVCVNPLNAKEFSGSIGLPISSTLVQIKNDGGEDLGIDQPGELCVKGPQVTQGYWNKPEENALAFTDDGFFRTGDIATIDEKGYVRILDRKKNIIIVSGFNVYPNEIEDVASQHPKVLEAAAIGIKNQGFGETIKLFVVRSDDSLSKEEVREHCQQYLTGYKIPREIEFIAELPKTNVGKISHKDLRTI